jgi:uncharacterized protein (TIGR03437 family)
MRLNYLSMLRASAGAFICALAAQGQTTPVTLKIELANIVAYQEDTSDVTKLATVPGVTPAGAVRNLEFQIHLADIVAVNDHPVKGTLVRNARVISLGTSPAPGTGIADVPRRGVTTDVFDFLNDDGTTLGTIVGAGPFQTSAALAGVFPVTGGSQAFLGMRGQYTPAPISGVATVRVASATEDPANRRTNGGGRLVMNFQLLPQSRPEIVVFPGGPTGQTPAVVHTSDFTLVSPSSPAKAGETLSVFVKGLGPLKPAIDPGRPFPASPLAVVTSPIDVAVNGSAAAIVKAVGYPGSTDTYQVDFSVPADAAPGNAALQVTAAWIPGTVVSIPIQS